MSNILFRKPNCVACDELVNVLHVYNVPYIDQPIGSLKADEKEIEIFPVMVVNGKLVEKPIESPVLTRLMLQHNKIKITYTKKNGEEREAIATLKEEFIPIDQRATEPGDMEDEQVRYYDLNVNGWRSFIHDNMVMMTLIS